MKKTWGILYIYIIIYLSKMELMNKAIFEIQTSWHAARLAIKLYNSCLLASFVSQSNLK
jgi:hypothetical protein